MSADKKKTPIIALAAVALLLAGGAVAYFTKGSTDSATEVAANDNAAPSQVETAAGDAAQPANTDGIQVEPGNPVVAKVDGKEIMRADVYRYIQTMPANVQQMPAVHVYPMAMEQVINTRIAQSKANDAKIEETDEFKREMEMAKQQLARNLYLQQQVSAKISDGDVKKAYKDYLKKIPDVQERHARHILVETEDKAKAVIEKLNKGGDFQALAKELSTGPTGSKGGDLGYFSKEEMVPEFSNAAFGMKKGTFAKAPVKTQFGWHVIQLVDVRERPKPTIEQMTPALRAELSRGVLDDLVQKWRKKATVEQFDINGKPLKKGANAIGVIPATDAANKDG